MATSLVRQCNLDSLDPATNSTAVPPSHSLRPSRRREHDDVTEQARTWVVFNRIAVLAFMHCGVVVIVAILAA